MHEMSLAESVRELIEAAAQRERFTRVRTVWLEIGRWSCVEPEALAFCFDAVMRGSVAENARLEVIALPGSAWCAHCAATVDVDDALDPCPRCGRFGLRIAGGTEMRVKEIEVE